MKVLLLNPPYKESTYVTPPLGVLYIASVLREKGHVLKIIDSPALDLNYDDIQREVEEFDPGLVGIPTMTPTIQQAMDTARVVKSVSSAPLVMGGPHASIMPEETVSQDVVDFVVRGEGERVMEDLTAALDGEIDISKVKGISYKNGPNVVHNPDMPLIEDLDSIPFPARDLLPKGKYKHHTGGRLTSFTTMVTSRGCPQNCIFCTKAIFGRRYRFRSSENVIDEIEEVIDKYKTKEFVFYDDAFTANKRRTKELCKKIIESRLDIHWKCESRVDTVDDEVLNLMRGAGCRVIAYGVETGNDELLKTLRKHTTKQKIRETFRATKRAGIETLAYIMIGIPGETKETIKNTLDFTIELDPDYVQFSVATPYPKTDLYQIAKERGYITEDSWSNYAYTGDKATPVMRTESLSQEDLERELKGMIKGFYLRPRYILKQISKSTSPHILRRNISGLRSILKWIK